MLKYLFFAVLAVFMSMRILYAGQVPATHFPELCIEKQSDVRAQLNKEYQRGNFSFRNPFIKINPYGISPLTAVVWFESDRETKVSVEIAGRDFYSSFRHEFTEYKIFHKIPIYCLYPELENRITLICIDRNNNEERCELILKTNPLPSDFTRMKIHNADKSFMQPGLTFIAGNESLPAYIAGKVKLQGPTYTQAFDADGTTRWFLTDKRLGSIQAITQLRNGNYLIGSNKNESGTYYKKSLYEINLLGEIIREYMVSGLHHDFIEMPNGNIVALCRKPGTHDEEDYIVEFDRTNCAIVNEWDLKDIYLVGKQASSNYLDANGKPNTVDWIHANAIYFDAGDNCFVVSGRNQDSIFKFEKDTREIKWIATEFEKRFPESIKKKLLQPVGPNFAWHHGQHYIKKTDSGDWIIFDNQAFFTKSDPQDKLKLNKASRALIFHVDEEAMTIEHIWQTDPEIGRMHFSGIMGSADYFKDKHVLVNYSSVNYGVDGNLIPDYLGFLDAPYQNAHIFEFLDNRIIFHASYDGNYGNIYRANRLEPFLNAQELD